MAGQSWLTKLSCGQGGLVLAQRAFRVLFLAAGLHAVVAMLAWLGWLGLQLFSIGSALPTDFAAPALWHAHEMLFGFTAAVIGGFLLTAVPNWTGTQPLCGPPIAALALVWLAGRVAVWTSAFWPPALVAVIDLAYLPGVTVAVALALVRVKQWRNLVFPLLLSGLWVAQGLVHLERMGLSLSTSRFGFRLAIGLIIVTIVIVAGRIVPNFTGNWLRQRGLGELRPSPKWLEVIVLSVTIAALASDLMPVPPAVVGGLALTAAAAHGARMSGWRTRQVLSEPILWVLHLGYGWLIFGFLLRAASLLSSQVPETAALHAFTIGAFGTLVLGIMSRASLGHTGRPLTLAPAIAWAYAMLSTAALVRSLGPVLLPQWYGAELMLTGTLWVGGFALFTAIYLPILAQPRRDGGAG